MRRNFFLIVFGLLFSTNSLARQASDSRLTCPENGVVVLVNGKSPLGANGDLVSYGGGIFAVRTKTQVYNIWRADSWYHLKHKIGSDKFDTSISSLKHIDNHQVEFKYSDAGVEILSASPPDEPRNPKVVIRYIKSPDGKELRHELTLVSQPENANLGTFTHHLPANSGQKGDIAKAYEKHYMDRMRSLPSATVDLAKSNFEKRDGCSSVSELTATASVSLPVGLAADTDAR
jgi:hypothetical protein